MPEETINIKTNTSHYSKYYYDYTRNMSLVQAEEFERKKKKKKSSIFVKK